MLKDLSELFGPSDEDNDKNVLEVHNNETFSGEEDARVVKVDVPDEADDDILIVEEVSVDMALIPASKIKLEPNLVSFEQNRTYRYDVVTFDLTRHYRKLYDCKISSF